MANATLLIQDFGTLNDPIIFDPFILHVLFLLFLTFLVFSILAAVCDEALAPALEILSNRLHLPHDIACATLLALGSSAPELVLSCVATFGYVDDTTGRMDTSMGTLYGSALFAYTVIPACCVWASPNARLELAAVPLLRDAFFFLVSVFIFVACAKDGDLGYLESLGLIFLFLGYLACMPVLARFYKLPEATSSSVSEADSSSNAFESNEKKNSLDDEEISHKSAHSSDSLKFFVFTCFLPPLTRSDSSSSSSIRIPENALESTQSTSSSSPPLSLRRVSRYFLPPFNYLFWPHEKWYLTLLFAFAYVALLSSVCLEITTRLADLLKFSDHFAGVVWVAFGAQIPDLFTSMAVAKSGRGTSAIASAAGSQVQNILIGIGLPFFISSLTRNFERVNVDATSAESSGYLLVGAIGWFLILSTKLGCTGRVGLGKIEAVSLIGVYVAFVVFEFFHQQM